MNTPSLAKHVGGLRLAPIERPRSLFLRFAYLVSRRRFGRVLSPLRFLYSRKPALLWLAMRIESIERKGLLIEPRLVYLIKAFTSLRNGCGFCQDLSLARAHQLKLGKAAFRDLADYARSPAFSENERSMLAYLDEIQSSRSCSDPVFETLRKFFSEEQIVEITWVNAIENYYNYLAMPLGLGPDGLATGFESGPAAAVAER